MVAKKPVQKIDEIKDEIKEEEEKKVDPPKEDKKHHLSDAELNDIVKGMVADKLKTIDKAKAIKADLNVDEAYGLSNPELVQAVLSEVLPGMDLEGKSEDFLMGAFEALATKVPEEVKEVVEEEAPEEVLAEAVEEVTDIKVDTKVETKVQPTKDLSGIKSRLFNKVQDAKPAKGQAPVPTSFEILNKFESELHSAWKSKTN